MKEILPRVATKLSVTLFCGLLISPSLAGESGAAAGSCDARAILGYCMEYRGSDWTSQASQEDCGTAPDGAFGDAPCPKEDRVGVCSYLPRESRKSEIVYVYYAPMDRSTAETSCPGTFTPAGEETP